MVEGIEEALNCPVVYLCTSEVFPTPVANGGACMSLLQGARESSEGHELTHLELQE